MKICTKCNIEKEEKDFPFKNKEKGVLNSVCKICQREYKIRYYRGNKESHYNRNKEKIERLKEIANQAKSSGCSSCSEKDIRCLDFHHTKDKLIEVSTLVRMGNETKLKKEIEKCIILCANCHRKLHSK